MNWRRISGTGCGTVPQEDAELIRKIHKILKAGKNVEIRQDPRGKPKVLRVSKEIEQ